MKRKLFVNGCMLLIAGVMLVFVSMAQYKISIAEKVDMIDAAQMN